ncbi:DNA topoisomerase 2-binding protein 1-A [Sitodiplosis mosellana]|uniref:DNA topoisomerase 2-binding protein 1-A n=1 Tax=Sitodiplosis mosellana TaxID=263140 RepID=UPI0024451A3E|nr:DNA topoisomerase 2-binding protein 1-A [Sitodiplosis mosellana]XP_055297168.1 DNA topoisomerase 2-binding protein 1-A [Sitodiplosis mosellana]XP_055297169.1 DNA topoisomerase 2-binding protein 1-A [Sitodiplosis mosellana]XP_055297170.1 DNA topoisomerase 2-binding protein 1-A [Sitodiplosis mosellana]XP_055297171.1 DNA topoisomerase 2-binding protein 1-A [Sitodiplosis mosellana]XP_055297172.1 DNA topoisomerase 2-binding protein 1-A [Sitodiplosis mosellana]XP_055297173.1 DNA topoisomerase 2-
MEHNIEQNLSLYEDKLQFYLVYSPNDSQLSPHMQFAREKLEENVKASNINEVTPGNCVGLSGNFTKKHIVVFDEFEGECFEAIRQTQALVLGPRCVISCMMDNVVLPYIDSPMYNLAMRDLILCLSSFDVQEKRRLKQLIGYMGGRCIDQLAGTVTHLVTESVRTRKYEIAVMQNMKIMKAAWIDEVWKENLSENILATDKTFDEYQLPIFYKLRVTTTGLTRREKKEVEDLVKQEGGNYFGEFSSGNIDVVIAKKNATETAKLKAALNQKKDCLCIEWITDSVKKGGALPIEDYRIDLQAKKHTSTPEKAYANSPRFENTQASNMDVSNIPFASTINDTAMSNLSIVSDLGMASRKRKSNDAANENKDLSYKAAYGKLDVKEAKRAGNFLDGCSVFMCGFSSEEKEKINKILNAGGATRFDTINSNVSHILIGSPSKKDITMLQAVPSDAALVKLDWLLESIAQKTAVDSDRFIYHLNVGKSNAVADEQATAPSPATKRNILLMSQTSKLSTPKRLDFDGDASTAKDQSTHNESTLKSQDQRNKRAQAEDDLIDQYLKAPAPAQTLAPAKEPVAGPSKTTNDVFKVPAQPTANEESRFTDFESESEFSVTMNNQVTFLANLKVYIKGFDIESHESLVEDCRIAGAEVIEDDNYKGTVDFLILPVDAITMNGINVKAKRIVNHNWLINAKRLHQVSETVNSVADPSLEIPYFYEPIFFPEDKLPLMNMNIVFSLYSSDERSFLFQLAQLMGAEVQESFIRASKPLLICPEARSAKYQAAIRWRQPVVNKNWLLDCYKSKKRMALRNYLVGDSIAPVDDIDDDEEVLCSQSIMLPDSRDSSKNTPAIPNRRVEQLRGGSKPSNTAPDSPIIPQFNPEVLNELDTPTRNSILQRFKELDEETPQTKRRRYEQAGIKTPECATTPYWMEYKRQQLEERRTRHAPTQEQIEQIKKRTPWSEVKRSLWKEALGDEYESPSQCYNSNIQPDVSHVNDSVVSRPTGRVLNYDQPGTSGETEADEHIQALADFISKGKQGNDQQQQQYADVPNTATFESEMMNTEQHEVIGWRDPSEVIEDTPKRNARPKSVPCFSISCTSDDLKNKLLKQIQALKGKVCGNLMKYDSACTHFVCEKPSRSEKMLSCVAAGKWVLGLSYIEKSYEANKFLDEEEFEWGNPKAKNLPHIEGANDLSIAQAAHRWRKKLQPIIIPSAKGIFKDFRVILKAAKHESMRTLIEAGRGQIIDVNPDLPLDKQMTLLVDATHILCQQNYAKFTPNEIKALDEANVHRVNVNYLQACITNETTPDVKQFSFKSKV